MLKTEKQAISVCWEQDRVEQPSGEKTANKGDLVNLLCNYSATTSNEVCISSGSGTVQLPGRALTFMPSVQYLLFVKDLLRLILRRDFFISTRRTVPLTFQCVRMSDFAVYYCSLKQCD